MEIAEHPSYMTCPSRDINALLELDCLLEEGPAECSDALGHDLAAWCNDWLEELGMQTHWALVDHRESQVDVP